MEVDVNGGEPTASKNYKKLLTNLPRKTKIVRMNTNGSRMIKELEAILRNRIMVIVTLSFDGVDDSIFINQEKQTAEELGLPEDNLTISGWVNLKSFGSWGGLLSFTQDNGAYEYGWSYGVMKTGKIFFGLINSLCSKSNTAGFNSIFPYASSRVYM